MKKPSKSKTQTFVLPVALLVAAAIGSLACQEAVQSEAHALESPEANPIPSVTTNTNVKTRRPAPERVQEVIDVRGTTLPDKDVTFSAETPGRVTSLKANFGERVKKGDLLVKVDFEMLRAQAEQARVNYDLATKTYERTSPLFDEQLISQQRLDEAKTQKLSAEASYEMARVQLKKSTVRSTLNGIVARKFVELGEYVNPGQPLLQVVDFSTVIVSAQVPESAVARIKRGMPVTVHIDALGKKFDGQVYVVIPASHPTARTFELRVKVDNPDYEILVGMATALEIVTGVSEDALLLDQDDVVYTQDGPAVFLVKDGKAVRRAVTLGSNHGDRVVITEGVSFDDEVVVEGQRSLVDGQDLTVIQQIDNGAVAPENNN